MQSMTSLRTGAADEADAAPTANISTASFAAALASKVALTSFDVHALVPTSPLLALPTSLTVHVLELFRGVAKSWHDSYGMQRSELAALRNILMHNAHGCRIIDLLEHAGAADVDARLEAISSGFAGVQQPAHLAHLQLSDSLVELANGAR